MSARANPALAATAAPPARWLAPASAAAIALLVVAAALALIVARSRSAWLLLGAGRGLIPEDAYHLSAFVLVLATTIGQGIGWAGGSALAYYVLTRVGFSATWTTARAAMGLVYLGLASGPLLVYRVLFGGWLLGLPRAGLEEFLAEKYPDARWLLLTAHPLIDLSVAPLTVVVLAMLGKLGEPLRERWLAQAAFALAVLLTSLAVALSLAIHSTLVHIRLG